MVRLMVGVGLVWPRHGLARVAVLLALALLPSTPVHAQQPASLPNGLPTHFFFGLAAHPDGSGLYGWLPESGVPWAMAYQYLAGGVNTNQGWETWNPNGTFALNYAQGAAQHGYIPMFVYYEDGTG